MSKGLYEAHDVQCGNCYEELIGFRVEPLKPLPASGEEAQEAVVTAGCVECDPHHDADVGTVSLRGGREADDERVIEEARELVAEAFPSA